MTYSYTLPAPKPAGRAASARNATTHGLFARDVVLPALGEDPNAYKTLLDALNAQIQPRNLLERHYVEKIAAASWRLRRLQRWQAALFEEPGDPEQMLAKLDRVLRHETALHRQIDAAVKMLGRDLPNLFADRSAPPAGDDATPPDAQPAALDPERLSEDWGVCEVPEPEPKVVTFSDDDEEDDDDEEEEIDGEQGEDEAEDTGGPDGEKTENCQNENYANLFPWLIAEET